MKKLFCLLVLSGFVSVSVLAKPLSIVGSSWPPYVEKDHPAQGLAMEVVVKAFKQQGYQPRTNIETWSRALEGVNIGVYDVIVAIWKTPDREKQLIFSQPYLENQIKFIKMKETDVQYQTLDDLRGYLIGIVKNYAYDDAFMQSEKLIKIPQNHIIQNLLKLTQGEIDLTLGDEKAIRYAINQYMKSFESQLEFLEKPLSKKNLYIAVSRQNPNAQKIVRDFNQALEKIKRSGRFAKIVKQYQF